MSPHQSVCTSKIEPCVPRLQWSSHDPLLCRRQLCHGVRGNIAASALSHQDSSSIKFPTLAVVSLGVQNASSVATHWVHLEPEEASIPRSGGFVEDLKLLCWWIPTSEKPGYWIWYNNNLQNDTICINMFMHSMICTYIIYCYHHHGWRRQHCGRLHHCLCSQFSVLTDVQKRSGSDFFARTTSKMLVA